MTPPVLKDYNPAEYTTYRVTSGDIQKVATISVSYIHAVTESLSFAVGGYAITNVNAGKGDAVKKGDILATLDTTDLDGPIKDIRNQISANNTAIDNCKALYEIDKETAALTDTAEQADLDYNVRLGNLLDDQQSLDLRLQLLEKEDAQRVIKADMDGFVNYTAEIQPGDISSNKATVFILEGGSASVFAATGTDSALLKPGMKVDIVVNTGNNDTYSATVGTPAELGISEPRADAAYMALDDPVTFSEYTYGTIKLTTDERANVLYIPTNAVNTARDETFVYLLDNNIKTVRDITTGLDTGVYTEITGGLSEGDEIIVGSGSY